MAHAGNPVATKGMKAHELILLGLKRLTDVLEEGPPPREFQGDFPWRDHLPPSAHFGRLQEAKEDAAYQLEKALLDMAMSPANEGLRPLLPRLLREIKGMPDEVLLPAIERIGKLRLSLEKVPGPLGGRTPRPVARLMDEAMLNAKRDAIFDPALGAGEALLGLSKERIFRVNLRGIADHPGLGFLAWVNFLLQPLVVLRGSRIYPPGGGGRVFREGRHGTIATHPPAGLARWKWVWKAHRLYAEEKSGTMAVFLEGYESASPKNEGDLEALRHFVEEGRLWTVVKVPERPYGMAGMLYSLGPSMGTRARTLMVDLTRAQLSLEDGDLGLSLARNGIGPLKGVSALVGKEEIERKGWNLDPTLYL